MPLRIEDYALIGDTHTAALVGNNGSIDWLCLPRFDSQACFAALLGDDENGHWRIAPVEPATVRRRYRPGTLILETEFTTASGTVTLIDFMPICRENDRSDVVRIVRGDRGSVQMAMDLTMRFAYGSAVPWVRRVPDGQLAIAGPDALHLHAAVPIVGKNFHTTADFTVNAGETVPFTLCWHPSNQLPEALHDASGALDATEEYWTEWLSQCTYRGPWREEVARSLITLKALTYAPTGGIVAAPTTSLPELIGGVRNWDYRYCWLRDATFTLYSLLTSGFKDEARAWRDWLLRAVAGMPSQMQIMYGIAGERLLPEFEIPWLAGYEGSRPVRIGNAAHHQLQLDVFGEITDTLHVARSAGIPGDGDAWNLERELLAFLEEAWREPDEGIWEVRGPRRHFTHSKVMCWVAFDRAIAAVERFGLDGPVERWRAIRQEIHDDVCANGFNRERGSFTQFYGGWGVDAALLMIPLVGFLPITDPRVQGTVAAVAADLKRGPLVARYRSDPAVDGLPGGEGAFLACSFWFVDCLSMMGRHREAREMFESLLGLANDVGLLSEEYDPVAGRQLGNFPQAFSHVALVNSAHNLGVHHGPAHSRSHPEASVPAS